jgi:hypothetical protein
LREEYKSLPPSDFYRYRASPDGAGQDVALPSIQGGKEPLNNDKQKRSV